MTWGKAQVISNDEHRIQISMYYMIPIWYTREVHTHAHGVEINSISSGVICNFLHV